jgi:hypothetical protein
VGRWLHGKVFELRQVIDSYFPFVDADPIHFFEF